MPYFIFVFFPVSSCTINIKETQHTIVELTLIPIINHYSHMHSKIRNIDVDVQNTFKGNMKIFNLIEIQISKQEIK